MENTTPAPAAPPATTAEDKTVAIVAYLTLIGFIVAIILNANKKTKLGAYHLRQVLGLILTRIIGYICLVILMVVLAVVLFFMKSLVILLVPLIYLAFGVFLLVCFIMGLVAAINGQMKPMPVVGPLYEKWFGTAFD
ncbi:MAG: hypothetical protein ABSE16_11750 [Verrucomicrobiota bacterium]|jgi:hypothetical protein